MSNEVFANGREISCKSGDGKSICEFPDVCMTPPTSPATPMGVPVPYPNTGFSRDTTKGSRTVKIDKKEVMLRNKSYYKTSTGDEAGCATPAKKGVITGTTKGKIYFISWSPDVKIEGENVVRTSDMTTHNHSSYPGNGSIPTADVEGVALAVSRLEDDKCPCCGKPKHAEGKPMNRDDWYNDVIDKNSETQKGIYKDKTKLQRRALTKDRKKKYRELVKRATERKGCTCVKKTKVLPKAPCDVFFGLPPAKTPKRVARKDTINREWKAYKATYQNKKGFATIEADKQYLRRKLEREPTNTEVNDRRKTNHLTPKVAGGCPTGDVNKHTNGNLQPHRELCSVCKEIDDDFGGFQKPLF